MPPIFTAVVTATLTFAATNIDDIFVLTLFFSQLSRAFRPAHIVAGQYLGFSALVAISLVGFLGARALPRTWIGFLGVAPILIGIRRWIHRHDPPRQDHGSHGTSITSVAVVTFANGGDNIGIYTPLFASSDTARLAVTLSIFYVLLALWCLLGYYITRHPTVARMLAHYGHVIVPFVFVSLGIYILLQSGTFTLFRSYYAH